MDVILFLIFAMIAVVCAINVVVQTHPISSALSLVGVMGSLAVLYLLLGAEFIAAAQVIVYAGAIMVLFIFVIMLLNAGAETKQGPLVDRRSCSACPLLVAFLGLDGVLRAAPVPSEHHGPLRRLHGRRPRRDVGTALFTDLPAALRSDLGPDSDRDSRRHRPGAKGNGLMMTAGVPISWFLILSAVLFALGVAGFLFRRNIITVFMSIELMLNAVNLSFVTFSYQHKAGQRPPLHVLRDGGGGRRSRGGPGDYPDGVQEPPTLNIDEVNSMKN